MTAELMKPNHPFVQALTHALGLPEHLTEFSLRVKVNDVVRGDCAFYASLEDRRKAIHTISEFAFAPIERKSQQRVVLKPGLCSPAFEKDFNDWLASFFSFRPSIEVDERAGLLLIDGIRISEEFLRAFLRPNPNLWFRAKREGGSVTIEYKKEEQ